MPDTTTPTNDKERIRNVNIIAWMLMLVMPVSLIFIMERIAFTPHPDGQPIICERSLNDEVTARITIEPLRVGQVPHQAQRLEISHATDEWQPLIDMILNLPDITPNCDENIGIKDGMWWLWNAKAITLSTDEGATWQQWEICNAPRPEFGCVRDEYIQAIILNETHLIVSVFAREGNYQVQTNSPDISWSLVETAIEINAIINEGN